MSRHNCMLFKNIYNTLCRWQMCFAKFWPFYLRHQQCYISGMHPGYVQWKKNTGFTQTSYSLYLISIISKKCQDTIACYLKIFIILYADDTVILSESAEGLQEALSAFEKYCNIWKLTGNTNK
jgi:hypothetical protein